MIFVMIITLNHSVKIGHVYLYIFKKHEPSHSAGTFLKKPGTHQGTSAAFPTGTRDCFSRYISADQELLWVELCIINVTDWSTAMKLLQISVS